MPVTCPVCGGPAGNYRLGTCSPGCDRVTGDDTSVVDALALLALVVVLALVVAVVLLA